MNYFLTWLCLNLLTPWFAAFAQANTIHLYINLCIHWTNCCDTWIPKNQNHVASIFQETSHSNSSCGVLITASKYACNNHTCMSKNYVASIVCRKSHFLQYYLLFALISIVHVCTWLLQDLWSSLCCQLQLVFILLHYPHFTRHWICGCVWCIIPFFSLSKALFHTFKKELNKKKWLVLFFYESCC